MNFCLLRCATNIGSPSFSLPPSLSPSLRAREPGVARHLKGVGKKREARNTGIKREREREREGGGGGEGEKERKEVRLRRLQPRWEAARSEHARVTNLNCVPVHTQAVGLLIC